MDKRTQAIDLHHTGQLRDACEIYEDYLRDNPHDADAWQRLSLAQAQQQAYGLARDAMEKAIALDKTNAHYYQLYGNILKKCAANEAAIHAFETALTLDPTHADTYNNLGVLHFQQGDHEAATHNFQAALHHRADYPDALYNLMLATQKNGDLPRAIKAAKQLIALVPEHLPAHYHLGVLYFRADHLTDAKTVFATVLEMDPHHIETLINMGLCCFQENKLDEAMQYYQRAIAIDNTAVEAHYNLAIIAEEKNNVDLAIQHYLLAAKNQPDNFAVQNNLGVAFMKRDMPALALRHFEKALLLQPDNEDIRYKVAALKNEGGQHAAPHAYIQHLFDNYAERFDQHVREGLEYRVPEAMHNVLSTLLPPPSAQYTIADLGCGTGLMGEYLKPYAKKLVGVDLSTNMIAKAREKNCYDTLEANSIEDYLRAHKNTYDLLIAADVFVYTGDLSTLIDVAYSALKKNGYFLFSCERTDNDNYFLLPSGRFAHNHDYITSLADNSGFTFLSAMDTPTRMQYEKPVMGSLYLFVK